VVWNSPLLTPIVWHLSFPPAVQQALTTATDHNGMISNSDLEMAGLLAQWLVLESLTDLSHAHVAVGCNNSLTIAWSSRMLSTKDPVAAHLLCAIAVQMLAC